MVPWLAGGLVQLLRPDLVPSKSHPDVINLSAGAEGSIAWQFRTSNTRKHE